MDKLKTPLLNELKKSVMYLRNKLELWDRMAEQEAALHKDGKVIYSPEKKADLVDQIEEMEWAMMGIGMLIESKKT